MTEHTFGQPVDPDTVRRLQEMEERDQHTEYQNALLNVALNQLPDAVFLIDRRLRFVFVNDTASRSLGYPAGLKGDDIPRSAQLSALCDVYSALITDRSYRKASSQKDAFKTMREEARGGAFNIELFNRFEEIVTARKTG